MIKARKPRKTYTKALKLKAIYLMSKIDRLSSEAITELSIRCNQLYK